MPEVRALMTGETGDSTIEDLDPGTSVTLTAFAL
jgi:hypothetical protein